MVIITEHDPYSVKLGNSEDDVYIITLLRSATNDLTIKVTRDRPSGEHILLSAAVLETPNIKETISNVVVHLNLGTIADKDKATIHLNSRVYDIDGSELYDFLPGTEMTRRVEKAIDFTKECDRYTVINLVRQKHLKELLAKHDFHAYRLTAYEDIKAARKGKIPAVNAGMPIKYHETHVRIEQMVFREPDRLPDDLRPFDYLKKPLLKQHMKSHKLAYEIQSGKPLTEDWYE
ncbi:MAG: hypothetical protein ACFFG0_41170 [Candidatus Thorarchaeota archaeon]